MATNQKPCKMRGLETVDISRKVVAISSVFPKDSWTRRERRHSATLTQEPTTHARAICNLCYSARRSRKTKRADL